MKKLGLLAGIFILSSGFSYALDLGEAIPLLKLTNEEVVSQNPDDQRTAALVEAAKQNKALDPESVEWAKRYCQDTLEKIGTPRLRKKALNQIMKTLDDQILWAADNRPQFDEYDGRQLSLKIRKRLKSLLEFEAERYSEFLKALSTVQAPD